MGEASLVDNCDIGPLSRLTLADQSDMASHVSENPTKSFCSTTTKTQPGRYLSPEMVFAYQIQERSVERYVAMEYWEISLWCDERRCVESEIGRRKISCRRRQEEKRRRLSLLLTSHNSMAIRSHLQRFFCKTDILPNGIIEYDCGVHRKEI